MHRIAVPIALLALLVSTAARADEIGPSVVVRLEPPITPLHEPAMLYLEVEIDRRESARWPGLVERLDESIGIFGEPVISTASLPNERVRITTTIMLDPLEIGEYPVGAMQFSWGDEGNALNLPGPMLIVREPTEEERASLEVMQENAPTPMPRSPLGWQVYAIGLIAAAIIGAIIGWWLRTRGREDFYAPSTLKPWERAIEALRSLRDKKLAERGEHEPYFIDLSGILRSYIEGRFHLHAPEMTTEEFLQSATESGLLTIEQQDFLARFLKQSDRVKFAKLVPPLEDMKSSLAQVMDFVEETIPREDESAEPGEKAA